MSHYTYEANNLRASTFALVAKGLMFLAIGVGVLVLAFNFGG